MGQSAGGGGAACGRRRRRRGGSGRVGFEWRPSRGGGRRRAWADLWPAAAHTAWGLQHRSRVRRAGRDPRPPPHPSGWKGIPPLVQQGGGCQSDGVSCTPPAPAHRGGPLAGRDLRGRAVDGRGWAWTPPRGLDRPADPPPRRTTRGSAAVGGRALGGRPRGRDTKKRKILSISTTRHAFVSSSGENTSRGAARRSAQVNHG